jgi:hypothetical protein
MGHTPKVVRKWWWRIAIREEQRRSAVLARFEWHFRVETPKRLSQMHAGRSAATADAVSIPGGGL